MELLFKVSMLHAFFRLARFRWYQGFYPAGSQPVTWAIDNVYIGPQCEEMCNGHGSCINGTKCICDPGYSGPTCKISTKNSDFLKDDFEGIISILGESRPEFCLSVLMEPRAQGIKQQSLPHPCVLLNIIYAVGVSP